MGFLKNSTSGLDRLRAEMKEKNNALPKEKRKSKAELEREVSKIIVRSVRGR